MSKRVESAIQRAVVRWVAGTYDHVKVVATLNENNKHCMDMGCDLGITDLIIHWTVDGTMYTLFLELKTTTGSLQESQEDWAFDYQYHYAATNTYYGTAFGYEKAIEIIACVIDSCMLKKHK